MAPCPVWQHNHSRADLTEFAHDLYSVLIGVLDTAVGYIECLPPAYAENARCLCGLRSTVCSRTACASFALSQIKDRCPPTQSLHSQERATAGLLYVVTVRRN